MKWVGAALSLLLAACTHLPYKPQITAPAEKVSLPALVQRSLTPDMPEQFFIYIPSKDLAYHIGQDQSIAKVALNTQQYLQIMWNEHQIYDIHTHPKETASIDNIELAVKRSIKQMNTNWFADERFRRFTPSVDDIAALVRESERFNSRKSYNREQGSIRFFIASEDGPAFLTEYSLKQKGDLAHIVQEYAQLLNEYQSTDRRDFREFQEMVNKQSKYVRLQTHKIGEPYAAQVASTSLPIEQ